MSKPLTKTQVQHLEERLNGAIRNALDALAEKQPKPKPLTATAIITALRKGDFKVIWNKSEVINYRTDLFDVVEFSAVTANEKQRKQNIAEVDAVRARLEKKKQAIIDQAVLGDAESALREMEKFIAYINK